MNVKSLPHVYIGSFAAFDPSTFGEDSMIAYTLESRDAIRFLKTLWRDGLSERHLWSSGLFTGSFAVQPFPSQVFVASMMNGFVVEHGLLGVGGPYLSALNTLSVYSTLDLSPAVQLGTDLGAYQALQVRAMSVVTEGLDILQAFFDLNSLTPLAFNQYLNGVSNKIRDFGGTALLATDGRVMSERAILYGVGSGYVGVASGLEVLPALRIAFDSLLYGPGIGVDPLGATSGGIPSPGEMLAQVSEGGGTAPDHGNEADKSKGRRIAEHAINIGVGTAIGTLVADPFAGAVIGEAIPILTGESPGELVVEFVVEAYEGAESYPEHFDKVNPLVEPLVPSADDQPVSITPQDPAKAEEPVKPPEPGKTDEPAKPPEPADLVDLFEPIGVVACERNPDLDPSGSTGGVDPMGGNQWPLSCCSTSQVH